MRLFVAVDVDDPARASIGAEQSRLRSNASGGSALRWVRPEQLHMTLVFLGNVDDARAEAVACAYAEPFARPPFDLLFRGLGVFPPGGAPRALWVGVAEGEAELRDLQRELAARAHRLQIPLEERPFSPHLTLARWKTSRASDRRILDHASTSALARVRVDCATLYRSQLSSSGPAYTALARVTLTASP
jgi:RNA 2',3'-cyclic 3'-phosphodiesterase